MFVQRCISKRLQEAKNYYQVITVIGPRQSGKTTLVRKMFDDYEYINLEQPEHIELAKYDPNLLLNKSDKIILDEVQNYPQLLSTIQVLVDENPKRKFVLTGSNHLLLMEKVSQSLAGRTHISVLLPFSISELPDNKLSTDELIFKGFFPAIYSRNIPPQIYYSDYFSTYVQKDVRQLINIKDFSVFTRFVRMLATNIGSVLNYNAYANELGVSIPTIKNWLSVLEASFVVYLLKPYYGNIRKRLTKKPKLYFYDTGLAAYLLFISSPQQLYFSRYRGFLFENMVVMEFLKKKYNTGWNMELYYIRDNTGNEVDLIVESSEGLHLIEIKSAKTFNSQFLRGLNIFEKALKDVKEKILIYDGESFSGSDVQILNYKDALFKKIRR